MKRSIEAVSFRDLEQDCEYRFMRESPFWHLYTDGNTADIIFSSNEDFKSGMNILGVCCLRSPEIKVYTFTLMNNHLHIILSGDPQKCREMFDRFRLMLKRHFIRSGRVVNLKYFNCQLIPINSLQSLRNEIAYVNRNGFVVRPDCTPFSYPWGAGAAFFSPLMKLLPSVSYDSLKVKQKREICRSNNVDIPSSKAMVYEEMYSAVCALGLKMYNVKNPTLLGTKERIEMARQMRQKYNASNRQIRNILKLDNSIVDTLFPQPPH